MTSVIGQALMLVLGSKDTLIIIAAFTISLSIVYSILAAWRYKH